MTLRERKEHKIFVQLSQAMIRANEIYESSGIPIKGYRCGGRKYNHKVYNPDNGKWESRPAEFCDRMINTYDRQQLLKSVNTKIFNHTDVLRLKKKNNYGYDLRVLSLDKLLELHPYFRHERLFYCDGINIIKYKSMLKNYTNSNIAHTAPIEIISHYKSYL